MPLRFADGYATDARVFSFDGLVDGREHLAFGLGDRAAARPVGRTPGRRRWSGRTASASPATSFGSQRCDCGPQLREAVERIADAGGYLLYLRQEGRGIGLYAKLDAYALQDTGLDTYEANVALGHGEDERSYLVAAQMLQALGVVAGRPAQQQPGQGPAASPLRRDRRRAGADRRARCPPRTAATWRRRRGGARTRSTSGSWPAYYPAPGREPNALRKRSRKASIGQTGACRAGPQAVLPAPPGDLVQHRRVVGDDRDRHVVARRRRRR